MLNAIKPGIYENYSIEAYHNDSAVGSSTLKTLANKTPLHLKAQVYKESSSFDFGSALHRAVLEPHMSDTIIRGPDDRRGARWKDAKAEADAKGCILLVADDYDAVFRACESVRANDTAASLLTGNVKTEVSLFTELDGLRVKIRPDLVNFDSPCLVDLKTTQSAAPDSFARSCADYMYHVQASFYQRVWEHYHGIKLQPFVFIAVEKVPPYAVACYELDELTMEEGANVVDNMLDLYKRCIEQNEWKGYPEGIGKLRIPGWAFKTIDLNEVPLIRSVA